MTEQDITDAIRNRLPDAQISLSGEGCNFGIRIVSSAFAGKSLLAQHQMVNQALGEYIRSGALHAITLDTRAPESA